MARLSEYNFDLCREICEQVANGFNIKTVLKSKTEYPDFTTFVVGKENMKNYATCM